MNLYNGPEGKINIKNKFGFKYIIFETNSSKYNMDYKNGFETDLNIQMNKINDNGLIKLLNIYKNTLTIYDLVQIAVNPSMYAEKHWLFDGNEYLQKLAYYYVEKQNNNIVNKELDRDIKEYSMRPVSEDKKEIDYILSGKQNLEKINHIVECFYENKEIDKKYNYIGIRELKDITGLLPDNKIESFYDKIFEAGIISFDRLPENLQTYDRLQKQIISGYIPFDTRNGNIDVVKSFEIFLDNSPIISVGGEIEHQKFSRIGTYLSYLYDQTQKFPFDIYEKIYEKNKNVLQFFPKNKISTERAKEFLLNREFNAYNGHLSSIYDIKFSDEDKKYLLEQKPELIKFFINQRGNPVITYEMQITALKGLLNKVNKYEIFDYIYYSDDKIINYVKFNSTNEILIDYIEKFRNGEIKKWVSFESFQEDLDELKDEDFGTRLKKLFD